MTDMRISRFLPLILVPVLVSCEKELDFDYRDIDPILVIEASLDDLGARVSLTETTPMDQPMDRTRLTDAVVTVEDLTAGDMLPLVPDEDGLYVSQFAGVTGHEYRLNLRRGDKTYASECVMPEKVVIENMEFGWIRMPYDHVAVLKVSFKDISATPGDCYWVRVYRNGEPYMWTETTDNVAADGVIDEVMMTSRMDISEEEDDTVLRDGDVVTATVTPISRAMYDYLVAISNGSNGPAMFTGDFCLGYFLAAPVTAKTITFHPAEMPYY